MSPLILHNRFSEPALGSEGTGFSSEIETYRETGSSSRNWLFARDPADLDQNERSTVTTICQISETARQTYKLVHEFRYMLHHGEGEKLDDWRGPSHCQSDPRVTELCAWRRAQQSGSRSSTHLSPQ